MEYVRICLWILTGGCYIAVFHQIRQAATKCCHVWPVKDALRRPRAWLEATRLQRESRRGQTRGQTTGLGKLGSESWRAQTTGSHKPSVFFLCCLPIWFNACFDVYSLSLSLSLLLTLSLSLSLFVFLYGPRCECHYQPVNRTPGIQTAVLQNAILLTAPCYIANCSKTT